jgi:phosphoserine phosphatase
MGDYFLIQRLEAATDAGLAQDGMTTEDFFSIVLEWRPKVAVFDCDGTLWQGDAGLQFMTWSLEQGLVSRDTADWILGRYASYRRGEVSELAICGEMTQIYAGLGEAEIRRAAARFFEEFVAPQIFVEMLELTRQLTVQGAELWAVSSTNVWVIEEGVRRFGIPAERVLGARVCLHEGRATDQLMDVPTGEGKRDALHAVGFPKPDAVFGNSIHDAAMMAAAAHAFAVNPTPALLELAEAEGWPVYFPINARP